VVIARALARVRRPALTRKRVVVAVLVVVALVVVAFLVNGLRPHAAASDGGFRVPVLRGSVRSQVTGTGTVQPVSQADANFTVGGTVTEVDVKLGDAVKKGQALAKVDPTALQQALDQATRKKRLDQESVNISLTKDQQTLGQLQGQYNADGCPGSNPTAAQKQRCGADSDAIHLQQMTNAHDGDTDQGQLDDDQHAIDTAQTNLDGATLTSPIDGVVIGDNARVGSAAAGGGGSSGGGGSTGSGGGGDTSSPGRPGAQSSGGGQDSGSSGGGAASGGGGGSALFTIADTSSYQVIGKFAEVDIAKLRADQQAVATFDALPGTTITGKVASIANLATTIQNVTDYQVTFQLDRTDPLLRTGMTANVVVITAHADGVLMVPNHAVIHTGSRTYLQVVRRGAKSPATIPVVVGLVGSTYTEVRSGVSEGDQVVMPGAGSAQFGSGPIITQQGKG
jgi:multidrug efflux pump subunit AcrA (membrane-fusion protein)